ncbi:MAG: hypothetical protein F6K14_28385 [Symploca sp. SIO2C1]|nr:hypothetical protein [Symploca sp. SIO2C1]
MNEGQLRELITQVQMLKIEVAQQQEGSLEWEQTTKSLRKALDRLLLEIPRLPRLAKCNHQEYEEVLDDTLIEVASRIDEFQPQHDSITRSFVAWINYRLRLHYRVIELYAQGRQPPAISLEQLLINKGSQPLRNTKFTYLDPPEPEASIAKRIWEYIDQDPEGKLRNCILRRYPDCNAQAVAKILYSSNFYKANGQANLKVLAQHFDIPYKTFYSYWKKHCQPLLSEIARKLGNSKEDCNEQHRNTNG